MGHDHGIPRFVFVKAPVEIKPLYLDLDSPIYMEILAKLIRRMSRESGQPFHRYHRNATRTEPTVALRRSG